eukprot:218051_1
MSSCYKHRLHLLSFGYARSHTHNLIPNGMMELLFLWLKSKPFVYFNQICSAPRFQMELGIDNFSSIILPDNTINKYEIQFIQYDEINMDIKQFITKHKSKIDTIIIYNNNIYSTQLMSFIDILKIGSHNGFDYLIKVMALQSENTYNKIICESKWKRFKIGYPFLRIAHHNKQQSTQFFEENIDVENKGYITINEWIIFCKTYEIELDLIDQKRSFHFMEYLAKKDKNKKYNKGIIDKYDFTKLVCHDYYNMYLHPFRNLIDKYKNKMNESASDIDDDYVFVFT